MGAQTEPPPIQIGFHRLTDCNKDTANAYSNGQTEAIIGRVIKDFNIPRRKLVLMTKVGRILADTEHGESSDFVAFLDESVQKSKDYVNQYGKSSILMSSSGPLSNRNG